MNIRRVSPVKDTIWMTRWLATLSSVSFLLMSILLVPPLQAMDSLSQSLPSATPPSPVPPPISATSPEIRAKVKADFLYSDAQTAMTAGDVKRAVQKWETAAVIYHSIGDLLSEADCYLQLAPLYMTQGDLEAAMNRYLKAFVSASEVYEILIVETISYDKEVIAKGNALYESGKTLFSEKKYAAALNKFVAARAVYESTGYRIGELRAIVGQMQVYFAQQNYLVALTLALEAYTIADALPIGTPTDELYINGLHKYEAGDFQGAIATWEDVVELYIEEENLSDEAITRSNLGNAHAALGHYDEALKQYDLALPVFLGLGDQANEATVQHNLGNVYILTARYPEALSAYSRALALWQAQGEKTNEAATLSGLGLWCRETGELDQALVYFEQALDLQVRLHDKDGQADSYSNIGYVYYTRTDYADALSHFERAVAVWRETENQLKVANGLINMGSVYAATGRHQAALNSLHEALSIQVQLENLDGQASTLVNIGDVRAQQGEYQEALGLYQESLQIFQQIRSPIGEASTLSNIGAIYLILGNSEQAQDNLEKARELFRKIGSSEREAITLNNLGLVAMQNGMQATALKNYEDALQIWRSLDSAAGQATTLGNIGTLYLQQQQPETALVWLEEAITLTQETDNPLLTCRILNMTGIVHTLLGRYDLAQEQHEQVLMIAEKTDDLIGQLGAYFGLGVISFSQEEPEEAFEHFQQAVELLDGLLETLTVEQLKTSFASQIADSYELMVLTSLELDRPQIAFEYAERGRARTLLTLLGNQRVDPKASEDSELIQQEMQLRGELAALQGQLQEEWSKPSGRRNLQQINYITTNLESRRKEYEHLITQLQLTNSEYAALISVAPLVLEDAQLMLREQAPDTTLIAYFVCEEAVIIFVIGPQSFYVQTVSVSREALHHQVEILLAQMKATPLLPNAWQEPAQVLYDWLIAPVQECLPAVDSDDPPRLGIIPHDLLHYLPFNLLCQGDRTLIEDYTLFYAPSVSSLRFIFEKRHLQPDSVLVFANSDIPGAEPLGHAVEEAKTVAALYETQPLIGVEATERNFKEKAAEYGLIHVAAHSDYSSYAPLFSAILLVGDGEEDGRLEAHEVLNLDLRQTDLVVLSACETHLGHLSHGDELVGLERAFVRAGTPSLLSTLWPVDDAATSTLMEHFYTHLRSGVPKAESLRLAQTKTRAEHPEPYYWAGFVLVGDAGVPAEGPMSQEDRVRWLCSGAAIIFALVAVGTLVWRRRKKCYQDSGG